MFWHIGMYSTKCVIKSHAYSRAKETQMRYLRPIFWSFYKTRNAQDDWTQTSNDTCHDKCRTRRSFKCWERSKGSQNTRKNQIFYWGRYCILLWANGLVENHQEINNCETLNTYSEFPLRFLRMTCATICRSHGASRRAFSPEMTHFPVTLLSLFVKPILGGLKTSKGPRKTNDPHKGSTRPTLISRTRLCNTFFFFTSTLSPSLSLRFLCLCYTSGPCIKNLASFGFGSFFNLWSSL